MYCYNCGCKIEDNANFCYQCGVKIKNGIAYEEVTKEQSDNEDELRDLRIAVDNIIINPRENFKIVDKTIRLDKYILNAQKLYFEVGYVFDNNFEELVDYVKENEPTGMPGTILTKLNEFGKEYTKKYYLKLYDCMSQKFNNTFEKKRYLDYLIPASWETNIPLLEWEECLESFKDELDSKHEEIQRQRFLEIENRGIRKQNRSRVIGGGFGLKGFTKGVITAKVLNTASGLLYSTLNTMGNIKSDVLAIVDELNIKDKTGYVREFLRTFEKSRDEMFYRSLYYFSDNFPELELDYISEEREILAEEIFSSVNSKIDLIQEDMHINSNDKGKQKVKRCFIDMALYVVELNPFYSEAYFLLSRLDYEYAFGLVNVGAMFGEDIIPYLCTEFNRINEAQISRELSKLLVKYFGKTNINSNDLDEVNYETIKIFEEGKQFCIDVKEAREIIRGYAVKNKFPLELLDCLYSTKYHIEDLENEEGVDEWCSVEEISKSTEQANQLIFVNDHIELTDKIVELSTYDEIVQYYDYAIRIAKRWSEVERDNQEEIADYLNWVKEQSLTDKYAPDFFEGKKIIRKNNEETKRKLLDEYTDEFRTREIKQEIYDKYIEIFKDQDLVNLREVVEKIVDMYYEVEQETKSNLFGIAVNENLDELEQFGISNGSEEILYVLYTYDALLSKNKTHVLVTNYGIRFLKKEKLYYYTWHEVLYKGFVVDTTYRNEKNELCATIFDNHDLNCNREILTILKALYMIKDGPIIYIEHKRGRVYLPMLRVNHGLSQNVDKQEDIFKYIKKRGWTERYNYKDKKDVMIDRRYCDIINEKIEIINNNHFYFVFDNRHESKFDSYYRNIGYDEKILFVYDLITETNDYYELVITERSIFYSYSDDAGDFSHCIQALNMTETEGRFYIDDQVDVTFYNNWDIGTAFVIFKVCDKRIFFPVITLDSALTMDFVIVIKTILNFIKKNDPYEGILLKE